jgi:putative SOS response-associated peptidase YedK
MCGRFLLITPVDELRQLFLFDQRPNLPPRFNVAPSQPVPIVRLVADKSARELVLARWGLVPFWAEDVKIGSKMINARVETVQRLPAFREAYKRRRCLIPADGFYEWQTIGETKQPMLIRRRDLAPFAFAGLWERWQAKGGEPIESCTIVTTTANRTLAPIHGRMPAILAPADHGRWLDPAGDGQALLRPAPEDWLEAVPVSMRVNSPRNDDAACIEPAAALPAAPEAAPRQGQLF